MERDIKGVFEEEYLPILFGIILFVSIFLVPALNLKSSAANEKKVLISSAKKDKTLKKFIKKNQISLTGDSLDSSETGLEFKGEMCYHGIISKVNFVWSKEGKIKNIKISPKPITTENAKISGGSIVLLAKFDGIKRKMIYLKCKGRNPLWVPNII